MSCIGLVCLVGMWACSNEATPLHERPARGEIGPVTLGWFSAAGDVFRRLGTPEKTKLASSIETVGPDGPMPEIVSGSLESVASATAIMNHYRAACRRLGLDSPPPADILHVQPDLTCHGSHGGRTIGVSVVPRCGADRCMIFVQVQG